MIDEDMKFQRRTWMAQRAGWLTLCGAILAALLGFFGYGGASDAEAGSRDSELWLEYERYTRRMAPTELKAHGRAGPDGRCELSLSAEYLDAVEVERITPDPESAEITDAETRYVFRGEPGRETTVSFEVQPRRVGRAPGRMRSGTTEVHFPQLVYP